MLIQGLPSSIEKQFAKLSFAKNVTPLLKTRKIDFALVFCSKRKSIKLHFKDVLPALQEESKFWIAYPKALQKLLPTSTGDGAGMALKTPVLIMLVKWH